MRIWKQDLSVDILTAVHKDTSAVWLGMEFLEVGDDYLRARITMAVLEPRPGE